MGIDRKALDQIAGADVRSWHAVSSSNVEAIRMVEPEILAVRFKANGNQPATEYHYYGADVSVFRAMLASASKGKFRHQVLGKYLFNKVS